MTEHNISRHLSLPHYVCADIAGIVCQPRLYRNANNPDVQGQIAPLSGCRARGRWILVRMREDRRDDALPEGVIERVVDSGGGNTEPACGLAVDGGEGRE